MISIIVPVYNVEKYLRSCIDSILAQTYEDFELLLIDDGSLDHCGEICECYAKQDQRIAVFHKENGGLSDARNFGLDHANGEYILFADSDDLLHERCVEILYSNLIKYGVSACFSPLKNFRENIQPMLNGDVRSDGKTVSGIECMKHMLLSENIGHEAPAKLYKREVWTDRRFPIGKLYEDLLTTYALLESTEEVCVMHDALYFYRQRSGSIMHSRITEYELQLFDTSESVTGTIERRHPQLAVAARRLDTVNDLKLLHRIMQTDKTVFGEIQSNIVVKNKENAKLLLFSKDVRLVDKVKIIALLFGKEPFYFVYKIGARNK